MTYTGTIQDAEQHPFGHVDGGTPTDWEPISATTRYLSGAAYVDQGFAERVVDELVAQSHRAIAPTIGYDIVTVVRHCFRAQRRWLAQNALVVVLLLAGGWLLPGPTVTVYAVCLIAYFAKSNGVRTGNRQTLRAIALVVGGLILASYLVRPILPLLGEAGTVPPPETGEDVDVTHFLLGVAGVVLALAAVLTLYRFQMISIITGDLERGRRPGSFRPEAREIEQRLQVIADAQHGNILLHAGFEPFVGAGERVNTWSIATELLAVDPGDEPAGSPPKRVDIDPVDLVRHLRQRLAAMRTRDLPEVSRVIGLQLRDQVISSGTRWHTYPLIDGTARLPYSFAGPAAVEAIIRAPQTSARHFLRASVGAPEQAAVADDGRTIMPAEHQSVISSTFLHVAVEGGLLYVELVSTLLDPIREEYLAIDRYHAGAERLSAAAGEAIRRFVRDIAVAPSRLAHALYRRSTLIRAIHRADREAATALIYDFGARFDIREAASRDGCANYMQGLDGEKYRRFVDRRATLAIIEYLDAHGVDTSDFTGKVNTNQYNNTTIYGNANGPIATGTGAKATVSGPAAKTTAPGAAKPKETGK